MSRIEEEDDTSSSATTTTDDAAASNDDTEESDDGEEEEEDDSEEDDSNTSSISSATVVIMFDLPSFSPLSLLFLFHSFSHSFVVFSVAGFMGFPAPYRLSSCLCCSFACRYRYYDSQKYEGYTPIQERSGEFKSIDEDF